MLLLAAGFLGDADALGLWAATPVALAATLRGGNFDGANSKPTLPACASQTRKALKARRVRIETNLSSKSVLPVSSNLPICSRDTACCRMILLLLKSQLGTGWADVGTDLLQT